MSTDSHKNALKYNFLFIVEETEVQREQDLAQHKTRVCDTEEKKHQRVRCQGEIWNIVI